MSFRFSEKYQNQTVQDEFKRQAQNQNNNPQFQKLHKLILIFLIFATFLAYRILFEAKITKKSVVDQIHEVTFSMNRYINQHAAIPFVGIGQVIMDVCICISTLYWILLIKNFRYPVIISLFQYSRSLMLNIITMPFASYVVWLYPGFPSLSVLYQHTSDYFFSGHTGTLVILYLESKKLNLPMWFQGYMILSIFYIISMLLIGRVHYTIDVVGGFLYAYQFYNLVDKNLFFFDQIMNAPYRAMDIVTQKVKKKLLQNQGNQTGLFEIEHY